MRNRSQLTGTSMSTRPIKRPPLSEAHESYALADIRDVMAITRFGKSWINLAVRENRFPAPVLHGHRSLRWRLSDVTAWARAQGPA